MGHYTAISKEFFVRTRSKLRSKIRPGSVVVLNANDQATRNGDQYFPYRQNSDLFYLTGIEQEKTVLTLCPGHPDPRMQEVLFIIHPSPEMETWEGKKLSKEEASELSGIRTILWLDDFEKTFRNQVLASRIIYMNAFEYVKFTPEVASRDERFISWVKGQYPLHRYERLAPLLAALRVVKEPEELKLLGKAVDMTSGALLRVLRMIRPGLYEYQIEAEITHEFIWNGGDHAYRPIIASGLNACSLHYTANHGVCRDGDLVLMDFGAEYTNYGADCTRTVPVNGKFSHHQRELYESVLRIFRKAIDLAVPGKSLKTLNHEVHELAEKEHVDLGLYTMKQLKNQDSQNPLRSKYLPHGITHFIGLDVHDTGSQYLPLQPGMVITIEPGIYLAREGIGIRIEDDVLITENGSVSLMKKIPVEIEEIEKIMHRKK